jgi:hypothetical protein
VKKWKDIEKGIFEDFQKPYKTPKFITEEMNEILRNLKKSTYDERQEIKEKVRYEFPGTSKEKNAAVTFNRMLPKLVYEMKEKQQKNLKYYENSHYNKDLANKKRQANIQELNSNDDLRYGLDQGRTFRPPNNLPMYNDPESIIRIKEKNNPRDKSLTKPDFLNVNKTTKTLKLNSLDKIHYYNNSQTLGNQSNLIMTKNNQSGSFSKTVQGMPSHLSNTNFKQNLSSIKGELSNTQGSYNKDLYKTNNSQGMDFYQSTNNSSDFLNKNTNKKANPWLKYEYIHPGVFIKLSTEKLDNEELEELKQKNTDSSDVIDDQVEAWSCCISTNKNSQVIFNIF